MALKTKILYEFRQIETDQVLVLDKPAQITFILFGSGGFATINNLYKIQSFADSKSALGYLDYKLVLDNNVNEIDVTNYTIRLVGGQSLTLIIKYYEQPDK